MDLIKDIIDFSVERGVEYFKEIIDRIQYPEGKVQRKLKEITEEMNQIHESSESNSKMVRLETERRNLIEKRYSLLDIEKLKV